MADNAKVSLLIEALLRFLASSGKLKYTTALREAVEEGINTRERKSIKKSSARKKMGSGARGGEEQVASVWLRGSGERLRGLIDFLGMTAHP